ncbi:MAG: tetratricopeptide repeat protein [Acidobacteria bacterium]|nr:tetratricopeptide repeat protein [Acidobacteriota bacterium]
MSAPLPDSPTQLVRRRRKDPFGLTALLAMGLLTALVATACGKSDSRGPAATDVASEDLLEVTPPPDLEQLDDVVREQFDRIYDAVRATKSAGGTGDPSAAADAWGTLGQWFHVYGYDESAELAYRNAQLLDPEEPRWYYFFGELAEDGGRIEDAETAYQRAADLAPRVAAPVLRLADLTLRQQDLDRAEGLYRQILVDHPGYPGALLGEARIALARNRPEDSLAPLEDLARRQPEASEVNYSLSLAWRQLGDDDKADGFLARLPEKNADQIPLDSGEPWDEELFAVDVGSRTLTRRGVRAAHRGEHLRAAVLLGRAVAADPEGPEERINYALALRGVGLWRDAAKELSEAIRLAGDRPELASKAHLEMGRLLMDRGRLEGAARQLEQAIDLDEASVAARTTLGKIRQRQGRLTDAADLYATVRTIRPDVEGVGFWYGALLLALGRRADATQAIEQDLETAPSRHPLELLLARNLATGEPGAPEAANLARARKLLAGAGPPDVLYAETAAMVAAGGGAFADAVAWQQAAIDTLEHLGLRPALHIARRRLVLYREGERCETPWEADERLIQAPVEPPPGQRPPPHETPS